MRRFYLTSGRTSRATRRLFTWPSSRRNVERLRSPAMGHQMPEATVTPCRRCRRRPDAPAPHTRVADCLAQLARTLADPTPPAAPAPPGAALRAGLDTLRTLVEQDVAPALLRDALAEIERALGTLRARGAAA
jgi:hypothetical protein